MLFRTYNIYEALPFCPFCAGADGTGYCRGGGNTLCSGGKICGAVSNGFASSVAGIPAVFSGAAAVEDDLLATTPSIGTAVGSAGLEACFTGLSEVGAFGCSK